MTHLLGTKYKEKKGLVDSESAIETNKKSGNQ